MSVLIMLSDGSPIGTTEHVDRTLAERALLDRAARQVEVTSSIPDDQRLLLCATTNTTLCTRLRDRVLQNRGVTIAEIKPPETTKCIGRDAYELDYDRLADWQRWLVVVNNCSWGSLCWQIPPAELSAMLREAYAGLPVRLGPRLSAGEAEVELKAYARGTDPWQFRLTRRDVHKSCVSIKGKREIVLPFELYDYDRYRYAAFEIMLTLPVTSSPLQLEDTGSLSWFLNALVGWHMARWEFGFRPALGNASQVYEQARTEFAQRFGEPLRCLIEDVVNQRVQGFVKGVYDYESLAA